jgi:hypothetical protein
VLSNAKNGAALPTPHNCFNGSDRPLHSARVHDGILCSEHSPNVDIPIYKSGAVVRTQDKGEALIGPLLIQLFLFLVMLYHCLIWDRFVSRASERTAAFNAQYSMQVDLARGLRNTCYAAIGMDVFFFSIVVFHAIQLLNR